MNTQGPPFQLASRRLPILTRSVQEFLAQTRLLRRAEGPPSSLGLVVGPSGVGKTVAAHACRETMEQEQHASCALIDLMPHMTTREFLSTILHQLGENNRPRTSHEALRQVIEVLQQGKTHLLLLDQSDYLERSSLEALTLLVEKTPCSFLLIGLPPLRTRLNMVPSCAGRVSLSLKFDPLSEEELCQVFLPHIVLPGWKFSPENEVDLRLGHYLWENARPSLRRVCTLLEYASSLAQLADASDVTFEQLHMAVRLAGFSRDRKIPEEETEVPQSLKMLNRKRLLTKQEAQPMRQSFMEEKQPPQQSARKDEL
jgi:replication-associated recombination protein RarA